MFKNIFSSKQGGGCVGCSKPKPDAIIEPKPKAQTHGNKLTSTSKSSKNSLRRHAAGNTSTGVHSPADDYASTTSLSINFERESDPNTRKTESPFGKLGESVAVVKDSDNPYLDFRQSMLQMITENHIYTNEDLQELLEYYLRLNSPAYHEMIVEVFVEIWNDGVIESPPAVKKKPLMK